MAESGSIVLQDWIRDIPDFPKPGIPFKDITPMLATPARRSVSVRPTNGINIPTP